PAEPAQPAAPVIAAPSGPTLQVLAYTMDEQTHTITADDGTELITGESAYPVVTLANKAAEAKINEHFAEEKRDFDEDLQEYADDARALIAERGAQDFPTFGYTVTHSSARCDSVVASFIEDSYVYLAGAHGTATREGVTFDMATGDTLELEDIVTVSEDEAEKFVLDYLLTALQQPQYTELGLFDDYAQYLPEIVEEDGCFYLTNEGVMIVINDSFIASHAAGLIEVPIPYADFTILKGEYLPQ
ncbi:MAG: DUF4163 domain-containing protein, partial [Clostridia bacterium]|nr:DUF4163 domain-containing protein [Clostridia bacterium]